MASDVGTERMGTNVDSSGLLRQGTRSCSECRRRKTKCNFSKTGTKKCNECYARGVVCKSQSQTVAGTTTVKKLCHQQTYSLRERVAYLEALVGQMNHADETLTQPSPDGAGFNSNSTSLERRGEQHLHNNTRTFKLTDAPSTMPVAGKTSTIGIAVTRASRSDKASDRGPVMSLFDNNVMQRTDGLSDMNMGTVESHQNSAAVRKTSYKLLNLLPPVDDVRLLMNSVEDCWDIGSWASRHVELSRKLGLPNFRRDFDNQVISKYPVEIASMLIGFLIALDHLPTNFDYSKLHEPIDRRDLQGTFLDEIERVVVNDSEVARTMSGVECIGLMATYLFTAGKLQSAWHLVRRGIEYSMVLNLHMTSPDGMTASRRPGFALWLRFCFYDRFLSLILGYPYGVPDPYLPSPNQIPTDMARSWPGKYEMQLAEILGRIVDRNQTQPDSIQATLVIDQSLQQLAKQLSLDLWAAEYDPLYSDQQNCDHCMSHLVDRSARLLLYQPFLLRKQTSNGQDVCASLALDSARALITYYQAMPQKLKVSPYLGRFATFLVFLAAVLLFVHDNSREKAPYSAHGAISTRRDEEWRRISEVVTALRLVSHQTSDEVALQAVKILDVLLTIQDAEDAEDAECRPRRTCTLTIPCFGVVTIALRAKPARGPTQYVRDVTMLSASNRNSSTTPDYRTDVSSQVPVLESPEFCGMATGSYRLASENTVAVPDRSFVQHWQQLAQLPDRVTNYGLLQPFNNDLLDGWDLQFSEN